MRNDLRLELLKRFRTQAGAARALGMDEPRLSRILRCWSDPSPAEVEKFSQLFGARKAKRLVQRIDSISARIPATTSLEAPEAA